MMRAALNRLRAHSEATVMIGDRMYTDIVAGIEAGMRTVLVLTGIVKAEDVSRYPYRPILVVNSIGDLVDDA
jgi:NagD protein